MPSLGQSKTSTRVCFGMLGSVLLTIGIYFLCFDTEQADFTRIAMLYGFSFLGYGVLVWQVLRGELSLALGIALGCLIRVMLVFSFPNLSNDIYRFLWDGHLLHSGISPLTYLPSELMAHTQDAYLQRLYPLLNSPDYFTVYPPISQVVYYLSTWSDSWSLTTSAVVMKSLLFVGELCTVGMLAYLLQLLGKEKALSLIYFLNPLLIVEVMGQVHFEGVMIAFLAAALVAMFKHRIVLAGVLMACAVGAKLLPLMFMPALLVYLRSSRWKFLMTFIMMMALLFLPFFWQVDVGHFLQSIDLYFRSFEFNASVYYIVRAVGYGLTGYNQIGVIGPLLSLATFISILYWSIYRSTPQRDDLLRCLFLSFTCYLFLATTVHPWYLLMLLFFSVLLYRPWVWVWSGVVVLSYSTYADSDFLPNYWLIGLEYGIVMLMIFWDWQKRGIASL